jgi:hypothetical protein
MRKILLTSVGVAALAVSANATEALFCSSRHPRSTSRKTGQATVAPQKMSAADAQEFASIVIDNKRCNKGSCSAADADDTTSSKKARRSNDAEQNDVLSLTGCIFIRVGSTSCEKELEDLVKALGGEFTDNVNEATHCLDGGAHFLSELGWIVSQNVVKVFANGGSVVPISSNFPGKMPAQAQAEELVERMQTAEALSKKFACDRLAQNELCNAYSQEFPELAKANGLGLGYSGYLPLSVAVAACAF